MALENHRRIAQVWNWLPAFRAVAEYESIQRAALALSVSPSSLSRTIKLLEEQLGTPVFIRTTSGVSLTDAGRELLAGTRDAMRRVDEALPATERRLRVGLEGSLASVLIAQALARCPQLLQWSVSMHDCSAAEAKEALLCGTFDLVLTSDALEATALDCVLVGDWPWVISGSATSQVRVGVGADLPVPVAHRVTSLEAASVLVEVLKGQLVAPGPCVPAGLPVRETLANRWPLYASHRREVVAGQAGHLQTLIEALRSSKSGQAA